MAVHHHFQAEDRGAQFRPPAMRIYRRRVATVSPADDPADQEYTIPNWGRPVAQFGWYPLSLRWGANGQPSTLRIKVVLGEGTAQTTRKRAEDYHCNPGDRVDLMQMAAGAGPEDKTEQCWFTGFIGQEAFLIQAHPDVESVSLTAYGPELLLSHKVITGRWCANTDESVLGMKGTLTAAAVVRANVWEAPLSVVMNPNGRGNAWGGDTSETHTVELDWQLTSKTEGPYGYTSSASRNKCKVFTSPGATADYLVSEKWTAYTALRSVVEWVDNYDVISYPRTNWETIEDTLGNTPIGQVNLTGRNLLQAMNAILVPAGFGFALEPWADKRLEYKLIVFKLHDPNQETAAYMAPVLGGNVDMASAAGRRAMVQRVDYLRDNHNVKNHIIVRGGVKITERSLDFDYNASGVLQPAWDIATYDIDDYDNGGIIGGDKWASAAAKLEWAQRYRLDGTDYLTYSRAFRAFAWNEDGGLSDVCNDGATPPVPIVPTLTNFSLGDDAQKAQHRPRPPKFRVKYSTAAQGGTAGAFDPPLVLLGISGDTNSWVKVPAGAYTLSKDRCLIHFKVKDLAEWYPWRKTQTKTGGNTLHKTYGHLNFATALWNSLTAYGSDELTIRLTAGFEMDDSVDYTLQRDLDSSWPFDAKVMIPMVRRFKHRDVDGDVTDSEVATVDDESADATTGDHPIHDYAVNVRDTLEDATGHGSVVLRGLHRAYHPGQGLWELSGRRIDLTTRGRRQNKAASIPPVIMGITWHFAGGANKTELLLETGQLALPE